MEVLFTTEVRRHVIGYLALMKAKYPSIPPKDYFEKIAVTAKYSEHPPIMDVESFEELTKQAGPGAPQNTLCKRNIGKVLDSDGVLGLMINQFAEGTFDGQYSSGVYYQIYPLQRVADCAKYEHREHLPPRMRRSPGRTKDNVFLETVWDDLDEVILQSGLTLAVFSSPNPGEVIKKKTVEWFKRVTEEPSRDLKKSDLNVDTLVNQKLEEIAKAFEDMLS